MELFNNLIFGFSVALTFQNLWFCFIGVLLGTLIGVLPGIGPLATIAMLLPIATVAFGVAMEHGGLIPALVLLIPLSAAAGREFKWGEIVLLTIGLTIMSLAIFIWGLGLPYPLIKGIWDY